MEIITYKTKSGRDKIFDYINFLPEKHRVDAYSVLEHLEKNEMDKIEYKQWQKKIYEVYFYKSNRIFYVSVDNEKIYLLHACKKQKNKTERKDKKIIESRAKELGKILGKKFI